MPRSTFRIDKRKSSKPERPKNLRFVELAEAISLEKNVAIVACSGCINNDLLRLVAEEKERVKKQRREKARKLAELREALVRAQQALAAMEMETFKLDETIAALEDRSSRMLRREMLALGVLDGLPADSQVAPAEPKFVWQGSKVTEGMSWADIASLEP
ncbi:hypothetical protein LTR70_009479 [Exophiala xenobiotica]|uniref:Uncharacterized protein n=1 Tax=Lithohypha guttulata TaxID=1690604 RepID=A0ABR0JXF8_9EURO|nr:hypothetical protein LTR24_009375 [Lithohypha guttulata]KAK5310455.1 hypothetical protein LTR70_009479 [Exophiala xenobiotica]